MTRATGRILNLISFYLLSLKRKASKNLRAASLKVPGIALMTPLTRCKVIAAEGTFAVMTTHTTLSVRRGVMVQRDGRGHLLPLRRAGSDAMATGAIQSLPLPVPGVAEVDSVSPGPRERPCMASELVTRTARRDVTPVGLGARLVALVASRVRARPGGYRERPAASFRLMTGSTSSCGSGRACQVARVIEPDVEALQGRK
jgi:hypothetical protein